MSIISLKKNHNGSFINMRHTQRCALFVYTQRETVRAHMSRASPFKGSMFLFVLVARALVAGFQIILIYIFLFFRDV